MSLDTLAERVMRRVPCQEDGYHCALHGDTKDCPPSPACPSCHGTGTVLDPRWAALREALWERCPVDTPAHYGQGGLSDPIQCAELDCPGFVRRSRAEAFLALLKVAPDVCGRIDLYRYNYDDGWRCEAGDSIVSGHNTGLEPEDALSAALLAWLNAQEVT